MAGSWRRYQSACGDAPSDAFLVGAIQSAARSGRFSVEAGTRAAAPRTPFSASGILSPLVSLNEAEHLPTQSRSQRHYAPVVFGIIPECHSASFATGVQLRRNPQSAIQAVQESEPAPLMPGFSEVLKSQLFIAQQQWADAANSPSEN
jgi:hypothetical protein